MNYSQYIRLIVMSLVAAIGFATNEPKSEGYRSFENNEGVIIFATVLSCDGERVSLRRIDGEVFRDVELNLFSRLDQTYLISWAQASDNKSRAALNEHINDAEDLEIPFLKGQDEAQSRHGHEGEVLSTSST